MNSRRKIHAGTWLAATTVLLAVLYVAALAPVSRAVERGSLSVYPTAFIYRPLVRHTPDFVNEHLFWYAHVLCSQKACGTFWNAAGSEW